MRFYVEKEPDISEKHPAATRDKLMEALLFKMIAETKSVIASGIFKHPTGALLNSINGYIIMDTIVLYSDKRYARAQEFGVKPYQMWNLLGKTIPLKIWHPYQTEPTTIFRRVTMKALSEGKWRHPGFAGKYFMRQGIDRAMSYIPQIRAKIFAGENAIML